MLRLDPRSVVRDHQRGADLVLALVVYVTTLAVAHFDRKEHADGPPMVQLVVFGGLVCTALVFRRRWPLEVLVVSVTGTAFYISAGGLKSPLMLVTMIALYTFAVRGPRKDGWIAAGVILLVLVPVGILFGGAWYGPESIALTAQMASAVCAGDAVRNHRAYIREVELRAERAEQTREEEARRRVIDERLRIARELHDVLAHHIALINVQAGVAAHVLESEPAQARESLAHIRAAARSALEEVKATIGLLRQPNSPVELEVEPSPGLERLSDLLAGHAAAGLIVDRETTGQVRDLPPTVDLTAYRIIQEALTNVRKHGSKPQALLRLDYRPGGLAIEVANAAEPSEGEGHGLLGMRERALAVDGAFATGLADGHFTVTAFLPLPEAS